MTKGDAFVLRELYLRKGRLLANPGQGPWPFGDTLRLPTKGPEALVVELVPAASLQQPALFNARGQAALKGDTLALTDVEGEIGSTALLTVLTPPSPVLSKVTVNGRATTSFAQQGGCVTLPVTFAGRRFVHCQPVGAYDRNFSNTVFRADFTVPQRVFEQLARRRAAWPVPYTEEELLATWRGSDRLLLFVHIADPSDKWTELAQE